MSCPEWAGLEALDEIAKCDATIPVIVVTAIKSVSSAVDAIRRGAKENSIIKPFDVDELLLTVERTLAGQQKDIELTMLRKQTSPASIIVGSSTALMQTLALARRAMQVDSTVLITGESGTGKDLLARAIHAGGEAARAAHLWPFSCCAIPEQLVESELFGHERGSFTGANEKRVGKMQVADKGTLFLDEIGEMPLDAQSKLLRVLQGGQFYPVGSTRVIEVDVRFVCATNRHLNKCVEKGTFREDS